MVEPIMREVRGTLLSEGFMDQAGVRAFDRALGRAFPEAWVPEARIRDVEPRMRNDPKDRHILAAAVASGTPIVVTNNLRDFKASALAPVGVRAVHPDAFLTDLLERSPRAVNAAVHAQARRARVSPQQLLGHLSGLGRAQPMTPRFVAGVTEHLGLRPVTPPPREPADRRRPLARTRPATSREQ